MSYRPVVRPSARKDLGCLPAETRGRIAAGIRGLAEDPRGSEHQATLGRLAGLRRLRVGEYRVMYEVDDEARQVDILRIGKRESLYER